MKTNLEIDYISKIYFNDNWELVIEMTDYTDEKLVISTRHDNFKELLRGAVNATKSV
jgi:hypothetical protein